MTQPSNSDPSDDIDRAIVDAFRTYPNQHTPPTLAGGVMTRLQGLPAAARPRFRLSWFDWAISIFTTGMAGVGYVVWQTLPPQAVAQLQVVWLVWVQHITQLIPHLPG